MFKPLLIVILLFCISCSGERYTEPLSPEEALDHFQLNEDFTIDLFAAEPYVIDPVEMIFDAQGNAYVIEMNDYPFVPGIGNPSQYPSNPEAVEAGGKIRMLADTNGDGRIDQSTVFADGISQGTSILPWEGGLLVTSAPHILYLKDTTGDFRADSTEVLFTGFFNDNFQAQITNLRYGVDNWIYASNNGREGEVAFNRKPDEPPLSMRGSDFRFRLDRGEFERATGPAQFGQSFNDWGHRFITQNTLHIRHVVVPWRYLHRHPHMASTKAVKNINDHGLRTYQLTPAPYWRAERSARRQEQYDEQGLDRIEHAEDHFSGASGGTIYNGHAFPEEYHGNIFTGEHGGNLVHRDVLMPMEESPTYVASRGGAEGNKEFLASTDPWFRPSNFTVGPDGSLYVIDMYRQHVEHPYSVPEDLKEDMDYLRGTEHGRIYRIAPKNAELQERASFNLREMETHELAEHLSHDNQWWRLQAQRLLVERQDPSVVPTLETLIGQHEGPRARLHALYVLEGLNSLDADIVRQAMQDPHPGVREHGMILAEQFNECLPQLIKGVDDPSGQVAFQAALSLGEFSGSQVVSALAHAINLHGQDPWFRTAVLSSEAGSSIELIETLLNDGSFAGEVAPWKQTFIEDISYAVGSRNVESEIISLLNALSRSQAETETQWQIAGSLGLAEGLRKQEELSPGLEEILQGLEAGSGSVIEEAIGDLMQFYSI
ncbi:MAG: PVC-type heme-binding CxxCH protein [Balneolales bacterium]